MGRKSKYSKELKIETVKRYLNGEGSCNYLANEIGADHTVIADWVQRYQKSGDSAFDYKKHNSSYTKEFKMKVVESYLNGEGSMRDVAAKFSISKTNVKKWVKQYNSHKELKDYTPGGDDICMTKCDSKTKEEKIEIAKYCLNHEKNYKATSKEFNTSYANVYSWTQKYIKSGEEGLNDSRGHHKADDEVDELTLANRKIKKLEHKIEMLELDNKLLKKVRDIERRGYAEQADTRSSTKQ